MTLEFSTPSSDKSILENSGPFTPKFDDHGLITAVVTDAGDGALLMVAHMNAEALSLTMETGIAHYFQPLPEDALEKGRNIRELANCRRNADRL